MITGKSITEVLEFATARFKELNARSDVQAQSFSVSVSAGDDQFWPIPMEVVLPLYRSLTHHDREAFDIERTKKSLADFNRED